jgi:hypothetical protein
MPANTHQYGVAGRTSKKMFHMFGYFGMAEFTLIHHILK